MVQEVIAELRASTGRRLFAYGSLLALGALLIVAAIQRPPAPGWQLFLVLFGAVTVWQAERLRRATLVAIRLYEDRLEDSTGAVLARMDQITKVERGAFAFKPSSGFVLHLKEKGPRTWLPGLWWRIGRRVGVGGVVPANAAKFMAEQIAFRLPPD